MTAEFLQKTNKKSSAQHRKNARSSAPTITSWARDLIKQDPNIDVKRAVKYGKRLFPRVSSYRLRHAIYRARSEYRRENRLKRRREEREFKKLLFKAFLENFRNYYLRQGIKQLPEKPEIKRALEETKTRKKAQFDLW
jgi:hypothetical protein